MTEQQQHLINLLKQRTDLEKTIEKNKELLFKVQGAIEYLTQIGIILPESEVSEQPVVEEITN